MISGLGWGRNFGEAVGWIGRMKTKTTTTKKIPT